MKPCSAAARRAGIYRSRTEIDLSPERKRKQQQQQQRERERGSGSVSESTPSQGLCRAQWHRTQEPPSPVPSGHLPFINNPSTNLIKSFKTNRTDLCLFQTEVVGRTNLWFIYRRNRRGMNQSQAAVQNEGKPINEGWNTLRFSPKTTFDGLVTILLICV